MFNEFLVLGRIPGTNIQITFSELLLLLDAAGILFLLQKRLSFSKIKDQFYYYRLYWSVKHGQQLKLPV